MTLKEALMAMEGHRDDPVCPRTLRVYRDVIMYLLLAVSDPYTTPEHARETTLEFLGQVSEEPAEE